MRARRTSSRDCSAACASGPVRGHGRADQQDRADRRAVGFQKVTIFGQTRRRLVLRQLIKRVLPELEIAVRKSAREQSGDGGQVAFVDLAAADVRPSRNHAR